MSPPPLPPAPSVDLAEELKIVVTVPDSIDASGVDLDGAIAAYKGLVTVSDQAGHSPQGDWETELRKYAVDPILSQSIDALNRLQSNGTHTEGHAQYFARVTSVAADLVTLDACVDNAGLDIRDERGRSAKAGSGNGTRHPQPAEVVRVNDGQWLVRTLAGDHTKSC